MKFSNKYDEIIKKVVDEIQLPFEDGFYWIKAQSLQESGRIIEGDILEQDPKAVSSAGAKGIMQLMPQVYGSIDPFDPYQNLKVGVSLDKHLYNEFQKEQGIERIKFMLAAYNAGIKWIINCQTAAMWEGKNPRIWDIVKKYLHFETGWQNANQTIQYVDRICDYYTQLKQEGI